jgi:transketolase
LEWSKIMAISQRDAFWNTIYDLARQDRDVIVVSADMGAPALDPFRKDLPSQFVNVGIAEQQAILLASGLALEKKKVFAYAIAPFITLRCYEQIKVEMAAMNIPVTLVGVGAGFSYADSGPTHHTVEDLSIMRILPNIRIFTVSDAVMASAIARTTSRAEYPAYVRLDREVLPVLYDESTDFSQGMCSLVQGDDLLIISMGNMVHRALEVADELRNKYSIHAGVLDLFALPFNKERLSQELSLYKRLAVLEEHTLPGGLGSAVCEFLCDEGMSIPIRRFGLDFSGSYCYRYGGRKNIQKLYGLDSESLSQSIASWIGDLK